MNITTRTGLGPAQAQIHREVQCHFCAVQTTEGTQTLTKNWRSAIAGTWGMALARMLCVSGNDVQVWSALPAGGEPFRFAGANLPGMRIRKADLPNV